MPARTPFAIAAAITAAMLAGACSGASGLTTGSLFGGEQKQAAGPTDNNTPAGRALHVGQTAARAAACGYNFDAASLKANYLAAEAGSGLAADALGKLDAIYTTGFNGVTKAAAEETDYCNAARTAIIKSDLSRALAGDFSPRQTPQVAQSGGGLFDFLDGDTTDSGPQIGSTDWWDKQKEKAGR